LKAHSGEKKHDSHHILGKTMIHSTFWEKIWFAAHSEEKNMIDSTFWEKAWFTAHSEEKTRLAAHSGKKHDWQHIRGKT
jgi:hypothetical protein